MPELPDVAVFKRYFDATALHQTIEDVDVRDAQVLANLTASELTASLSGCAFSGTSRHGKYLFADLDDAEILVLHFGMTGHLRYYKDVQKEPGYTQVLVKFHNGYHLAYVMARKLGEVRLVQDRDAFIRAQELGPDALEDDFNFAAFRERLAGRHGMIKTRLMAQQIMAGIGNVYADEILFQARVHPQTAVNDLDEETLHTIFDKMKWVLRTAIEYDAEPDQFPDDFIIPQRHEDGECPDCGGSVERIKISGRTAYFCPSCQKKA